MVKSTVYLALYGCVVSLLMWNNPKTMMNPHELSRLAGNDCEVFFFSRSKRKRGNIKGYVGCQPAPGWSDQYFAINPGAAAKSPFYRKNWEPLFVCTVITSHHQPSNTACWWHSTSCLKASWWFMMAYQLKWGVFAGDSGNVPLQQNRRAFNTGEGSS